MQNLGTLQQPLLWELAMSPEEREREKNAIYSGHLRLCLQLKGSARTPLGPKLEEEKTNNADNRELVLHWGWLVMGPNSMGMVISLPTYGSGMKSPVANYFGKQNFSFNFVL